jgi:hypothetical protein
MGQAILIVVIFIILKVIKDLCFQKDIWKYYKFPKFWWRETMIAPKTTWFHKYFPMFFDIWHLSEALQVLEISFLASMYSPWLILTLPLYIIGSLLFNLFYEGIG